MEDIPKFPRDVNIFIRKALTHRPEDRPTATELLNDAIFQPNTEGWYLTYTYSPKQAPPLNAIIYALDELAFTGTVYVVPCKIMYPVLYYVHVRVYYVQ